MSRPFSAGLRSGHLAGLAVDVISPSPAVGRHALLGPPERHRDDAHRRGDPRDAPARRRDGGRRDRPVPARRAAPERRGSRRARRGATTGQMMHTAGHRPRDRKLPGGPVPARTGRRSPSASGSGRTPPSRDAPGSQVFDTARNWVVIGECIREALDRAGHHGRRRRGREQYQHARGHGPVRRRGRARSGHAPTSTREPARRPNGSSRVATPGGSTSRAGTGCRSRLPRASCGSASTSPRRSAASRTSGCSATGSSTG